MADKEFSQDNFESIESEKSFKESVTELIIKVKPRLKVLWEKKWSFVIFNGIVGVLAVLYLLFLTEPYFRSSVVILPDYGNKTTGMLSQFSGLASVAGISLGDAPSTQIYENLILSESVMSDVIYAEYNTEGYNHPVNLIEYFEIEPRDDNLPKELQERRMFLSLYEAMTKSRITTDIDRKTTILTVTVEMPESRLSADVANNIIKSLDKYVRTQRKSYASEQREYLDKRVSEVKDTLSMFEEQLKDFKAQNRVTIQSPELQLQQARLMRNVEIQQSVYTELLTQLELVKLEEVKDTPVVNLKEEAKEPVLKAGPKRFMTLIVIIFFSAILSSLYFMFNEEIYKFKAIIKA